MKQIEKVKEYILDHNFSILNRTGIKNCCYACGVTTSITVDKYIDVWLFKGFLIEIEGKYNHYEVDNPNSIKIVKGGDKVDSERVPERE